MSKKKIWGMLKFISFGFLLIVCGCGPAYQAVKRGNEFLEMKNYYGASQEYLTALNHESDHQKAKVLLCQYSQPAYEQKLLLTQNKEKLAEYETALGNYKDLSGFLGKVDNYGCLNFDTINVKAKIAEMQGAASEQHYKDAECLFAKGDCSNAISKYREALRLNSPYKDSTEKIAESYYRIASKFENQKEFRNAAKNYVSAIDTVTGYKDATQKATSINNALGEYYLTKGQCRNANNDFSEVKRIDPLFKNIDDKITQSDACAVTKIAFIKFENKTGRDIAGASLDDVIFDEVQAKLKGKASQFLRIMDREELEAVFSEQKLGMSGITDEYSTFKKLKGVHYLIFGKLSQVNSIHPGPRTEHKKTTGTASYQCQKYDRKGKPYNGTCYNDVAVNYSELTDKINVTLTGSFNVLSVSSGEKTVASNFSLNKNDSIKYATNFSQDINSLAIDKEIKGLANARKDLEEEDKLLRGIVSDISNDVVAKILTKIDSIPTLNDPSSLDLKR